MSGVGQVVVERVEVDDDPQLTAWWEASRAGQLAGLTDPFGDPLAALTVSVRRPNPDRSRELWAARAEGQVVGTLEIGMPLRHNVHTAQVDIAVPPEHRGRGVARTLWAHAEERLADERRTTVMVDLEIPTDLDPEEHPGWRFAHRNGFTPALAEHRLLLRLPVDPGPLAAAAAPYQQDYELVGWSGPTPPEVAADLAELHGAMNRDVPKGELDWEPVEVDVEDLHRQDERLAAMGYRALVAAARHRESARFVGYSVLMLHDELPQDALQDDTLVLGDHRGHRLGAALKAANLRRLLADRPGVRRIHTWTALDNGPMQHVNQSFGFRPVGVSHELQRTA